MTSSKQKIAIDIDGVLADMHSPVFKKMGLRISANDVRTWDFFELLRVDRQMFWETYKRVWSEEYKLIPLVIEDSPRIIAELRRNFEVHIMTNRPRQTFSGTVLWLKFHRIEYDKLIVFPPLTDKTQYIYGYLFLVDDNPAYAHDERVILFDRPWNQCVNAKRIKSLRELLDLLPSLPSPSPPQRGWRGVTGLPWGPPPGVLGGKADGPAGALLSGVVLEAAAGCPACLSPPGETGTEMR
jgi:5'(3')-deoxyribonucleotidase